MILAQELALHKFCQIWSNWPKFKNLRGKTKRGEKTNAHSMPVLYFTDPFSVSSPLATITVVVFVLILVLNNGQIICIIIILISKRGYRSRLPALRSNPGNFRVLGKTQRVSSSCTPGSLLQQVNLSVCIDRQGRFHNHYQQSNLWPW